MSRLGGLGIQAFTNLSGNASRLMSQAFDRTLNSQQFLISQLEQDRQRKLQQSYAEEQQEKAKDEALKQQLIATGVGVAGGALTGGLLAAAAPAAGAGGAALGSAASSGASALGVPAAAAGVSGSALGSAVGASAGTGLSVGGGALLGGAIGGLSTIPGGAVPAQLLGQSTPLFNPQIGINNQRLALDSARLANDTLATQSLIQSRKDNSGYQRDKLEQDASQFNTTNQRLLDTQNENLAFKRENLDAQNNRFIIGETGKDSRQQASFDNSLLLEDTRNQNRFDLADVNNRAATVRTLLAQDRMDNRFKEGQANSINRPILRGQQAGVTLAQTLSNSSYKDSSGNLNQDGIDIAMSSLLDGEFGPELPNVLNALGQKGFPVSDFLAEKKRRDPSFNFNFGGLPDK